MHDTFPLDLPTIAFVGGLVAALQGLLIAATAQTLPASLKSSVRAWVAGIMCFSVGFIVVGLRPLFPEWIPAIVANGLLVLSPLAFAISLRRYFGLPTRLLYVTGWAIALACMAENAYFVFVDPSINTRLAIGSICHALVATMVVITAFKVSPVHRTFSLLFICVLFALHAISLIHRALLFAGSEPLVSVFQTPEAQAVSYYSAVFVPLAGALGFMQLCQQRVRVHLERIATVDHLTGCLNRRAIEELIDKHIAATRRHGQALGLLLVDLDHFKAVNDKYGHAVGDQALIRTVRALTELLRPQDVVGRVGGEEFVVMLPMGDAAGTKLTAERIRAQFDRQPLNLSVGPHRATVSIGCASLAPHDRDFSSLLHRADRALYAAKEAGRNRVVVDAGVVADV